MYLFELSPDGSRLCIPGEDGEVTVLVLATGDVTTVLSADEVGGGDLASVPVWRSA